MMSAEEPPKRRRGVQIQCFTLHQCKYFQFQNIFMVLGEGDYPKIIQIQLICTNYKLVCFIMIHFYPKLLILDQVTFYYN